MARDTAEGNDVVAPSLDGGELASSRRALEEERARTAGALAREAAALAREAEALAQQTATSEILRIIAGSPTDVGPVLGAITGSAARLLDATYATLQRVEGDHLVFDAERLPPGPAPMELGRRRLATRAFAGGRAVLDGRSVQVADVAALAPGDGYDPEWARLVLRSDSRSLLCAPLLRDGAATGVLAVGRRGPAGQPRPFSARETALLEAFSSQAVIALENARLFSELEERLAEQTATAEILRVIAASPGDPVPVAEAIVERSLRLCEADNATLRRITHDEQQVLANAGDYRGAGGHPYIQMGLWTPLGIDALTPLVVAQRRPLHLPAFGDEYPDHPVARVGIRSMLIVPLVRDGTAVGLLHLRRYTARPFTDRQIALVGTFADQAVIALENARLFAELNDANATLKEALEQQTATSDVLRVIASSPADLQSVLDVICAGAARLCDPDDVQLFRAIDGRRVLAAHHGPQLTPSPPGQSVPIGRGYPSGEAMVTGEVFHTPDVQADDRVMKVARSKAGRGGIRTVLAVPLVRDGETLGVINLRRTAVRPFSEREIQVVRTFADQAVIAIENSRLFQELNESNATLKAALEQQTATAEVLQVISRSPADLQTVLDTICDSAARLCAVDSGVIIWRLDGDHFWAAAGTGLDGERPTLAVPMYRSRVSRGHPVGRAMVDRTFVHVEDLAAVPLDEMPAPVTRAGGVRTVLGVPLLRDGEVFGGIGLARREARPFTEKQIRLVHTFADQTVIAIENARLFTELQERDERRRQELERASAIQQRLLPSLVEGWPGLLEVAVRFRPAVETSGDFYDVLALSAATKGALEPLQIAVGDVAGKGMAAALVTALARSALQASASMPTAAVTPAGTLRVAGQRLHRDVGATHFVACALAVVEPPGRHHKGPLLRLANAGHAPVLLVRDGRAEELEPPGYRLPLGAEDDGAYEDTKTELHPGDAVVFSSDGLAEAPALAGAAAGEHLPPSLQPGELFGFDRVAKSVAHWTMEAPDAESVASGLWADLTAWAGDESHHDDMTLLVLRVSDRGA